MRCGKARWLCSHHLEGRQGQPQRGPEMGTCPESGELREALGRVSRSDCSPAEGQGPGVASEAVWVAAPCRQWEGRWWAEETPRVLAGESFIGNGLSAAFTESLVILSGLLGPRAARVVWPMLKAVLRPPGKPPGPCSACC